MDLAVIKRDGSRVPFNPERIVSAVSRAAAASGVDDCSFCTEIAEGVFAGLAYGLLAKRFGILSAIVASVLRRGARRKSGPPQNKPDISD